MLIYRGARVEAIAEALRRDNFHEAYVMLCAATDRIQAARLPLEDAIFIADDDGFVIAYLTAVPGSHDRYGDESWIVRRAAASVIPPQDDRELPHASGTMPDALPDALPDDYRGGELSGTLGYSSAIDLSDQQVERLASRLGIPIPSYGVEPTVPYNTDDETQGIVDIELSLQLLTKVLGLPAGYRITHVDQNDVQQRLGSACLTVVGPVTSHCPRLTLNSAIMRLQIPSPRQRNIHGALDPELHRGILGDAMRTTRIYDPSRGWRYTDEPDAVPRERSVQI